MADFSGVITATSGLWFVATGGGGVPVPVPDPILDVSDAETLAGVLSHPAAATPGEVLAGAVAGAPPSALIYERLLIKPNPVVVGHVASGTVERTGVIWNAHSADAANLATIVAQGADGITRLGILPGDSIGPMRDSEQTYTTSKDGPILIDALFTYVFDIGAPSQRLIGSRGVIILTRPRASGYAEGRGFQTQLFRALDGTDYALSDFHSADAARRDIEFPFAALTALDRRRLTNAMLFGSRYPVGLPLWFSLSRLTAGTDGTSVVACPTADREFVQYGNVVIVSRRYPRVSNFEVRLIEAIEPGALTLNAPVALGAFESGDFVLPLVSVAPDGDVSYEFSDAAHVVGVARFVEMD